MRLSTDCPKCGRSIFSEYDAYMEGLAFSGVVPGESEELKEAKKWIKLTAFSPIISPEYIGNAEDWTVECECPDCHTTWSFSDSNV